MTRILLKVLITALVVTFTSELAKRFSWLGAILASLPLTSILALTWLYWDSGDARKAADLSTGIFWAVLPSLLFFMILPALLRSGMRFAPALGLSSLLMCAGYAVYIWALKKMGV